MKKCPFCAEEIQDEAIKCKNCREWLPKTESDFSGVAKSKNKVIDDETVLRRNRNLMMLGVFLEYFGLLFVILGNNNIIPKNGLYNNAGFFVETCGIILILIYTYRFANALGFGILKRLLVALVNGALFINIIMSIALILEANKSFRRITHKVIW